MNGIDIRRYSFNSASNKSIEAKSLDFLWDKAKQTTIAHTDYNFFGPEIGFDIFRFEDGKIVEHWDNLQETPLSPNPSEHTMIDGTTELADLDKTEANKALVEQFVRDVLMGDAPEKLTSYFDGDNYTQHNPSIAEHWDVIEPILPSAEWKHSNGKFGF